MTDLRLGKRLLAAALLFGLGPACAWADEADTQARPRDAQPGRQRLAPRGPAEGPLLMGVPGYDPIAAPAPGSAQGFGPMSSNPLFGAPVPAAGK